MQIFSLFIFFLITHFRKSPYEMSLPTSEFDELCWLQFYSDNSLTSQSSISHSKLIEEGFSLQLQADISTFQFNRFPSLVEDGSREANNVGAGRVGFFREGRRRISVTHGAGGELSSQVHLEVEFCQICYLLFLYSEHTCHVLGADQICGKLCGSSQWKNRRCSCMTLHIIPRCF